MNKNLINTCLKSIKSGDKIVFLNELCNKISSLRSHSAKSVKEVTKNK